MTDKQEHYINPESLCFLLGSLSGCSPDCIVYQNGDCPEQEQIDHLQEKEAIKAMTGDKDE